MNNTQRKFLIEKVQQATKEKIKLLEKGMEKPPSLSNYLYRAVMNDNFELRDIDFIKGVIKNKALNAKEGTSWISTERGFNWDSPIREVKLGVGDLFVFPDEYIKENDRVLKANKEIENQIEELEIYLGTIEMRIQLSSDKILQSLINEIDDMGEIKLIDSKLRLQGK